MKIRLSVLRTMFVLGFLFVGIIPNIYGQVVPARDYLKVYLDCSDCELDYIRQNVKFIDYVNDRKDADLHVLVTRQANGGGQEYRLQFIGLEGDTGRDDRLVFSSSSTDTADELRRRFVRSFVFGLLPYISDKQVAEQIQVIFKEIQTDSRVDTNDPWDYWVFGLSGSISFNGQAKSKSRHIYGSISASQVTESLKIDLYSSGNGSLNEYILPDGSNISSSGGGHYSGGYVVKSLGGHWGVGAGGVVQSSKFYNLNTSYRLVGVGEYNLFPYKDSAERNLTLTYQLGFTDLNYKDSTILGNTQETLFSQGLGVSYATKSPWGDAYISTLLTQLGGKKNVRLALNGGSGWRIVRGLSLDISGSASFIGDQIYLSAKGLTPEEIFLERRSQATNFDYSIYMGFSFKFGSIYNNIVNSRFSGASFSIF